MALRPVLQAAFLNAVITTLEIGTGTEGFLASTSQHRATDIGAALDVAPNNFELGFGGGINRVHPLPAIERDAGDAVLATSKPLSGGDMNLDACFHKPGGIVAIGFNDQMIDHCCICDLERCHRTDLV